MTRKKKRPLKTLEKLLLDGVTPEELRAVRDSVLADAVNRFGATPPGLVIESRRLLGNALVQAQAEATDVKRLLAKTPQERAVFHLEAVTKRAVSTRKPEDAQAALDAEKTAIDVHLDAPPAPRDRIEIRIKTIDGASPEFQRKTQDTAKD